MLELVFFQRLFFLYCIWKRVIMSASGLKLVIIFSKKGLMNPIAGLITPCVLEVFFLEKFFVMF